MAQLVDFEVLHYLGQGSCGKVFQARKKNGDDINKIYAIKSVQLKYKAGAKEMNILTRIKHPMVVELFYVFTAEQRIFFVLEYLCGGTLTAVLADHNGTISEQAASFYLKEVIVALEYLHSEGIIYRDLKQSNILLDINGHIKLIDFGLSERNVTLDTLSFASSGTPYFKAPEIINKTGHGFAVDWWSMGILFYRMVEGKYPFGGMEEPIVRAAILAGKYTLSENLSINAKHLLMGLLQTNPEERLGSTDGAVAVKNHPFFENTSWENVSQRGETPPFIPDVENEHDTNRFRVVRKNVLTTSTANSGNSSASVSFKQKIAKLDLNSSKETPSTSTPPVTEILTAEPTTASPATSSQESVPPATAPSETAPPKL